MVGRFNMDDAARMTKLARLLRIRALIKIRREKRPAFNFRLQSHVADLNGMISTPDGALILLPSRYAGIEMDTRL
jgi:hypothetical protein